MSLTQTQLKELLHYDASTGLFTWRSAPKNSHVVVGQLAGYETHGYIQIMVDRRNYRAHRLAWLFVYGYWPSLIDHKNCIRSDNRIDNLREADRFQNAQNKQKHKPSLSGFKGVVKQRSKHDTWQATCTVRGVKHHLGTFNSPEKAHAAYAAFAVEHHGVFHNLSKEKACPEQNPSY